MSEDAVGEHCAPVEAVEHAEGERSSQGGLVEVSQPQRPGEHHEGEQERGASQPHPGGARECEHHEGEQERGA